MAERGTGPGTLKNPSHVKSVFSAGSDLFGLGDANAPQCLVPAAELLRVLSTR